jgi:hypothetical protein
MAQKSKQTMKEMLEMIDAKIEHIEDINADNRAVIIKLVKQSNQIVKFLKDITIEEITDPMDDYIINSGSDINDQYDDEEKLERLEKLNEFLSQYKSKAAGLSKLEEELEDLKDMITPGQYGEA